MPTYNIDIRFKTRVDKTPRVLEVAESFGIGLDETEFVIYDNLDIEVNQGDIVYITGQSGSGKSLLLRELAKQMEQRAFVSRLEDIELRDKTVIDQIGKDTNEAINLLAKAGISDAFLYARKPTELSDGQRYRVKLAKLIESGAEVWVADEFGAVLDRVTAKGVAYNMSLAARRAGATLIVATTHTDLKAELGPTVTVTKHYRERLKVETDPNADPQRPDEPDTADTGVEAVAGGGSSEVSSEEASKSALERPDAVSAPVKRKKAGRASQRSDGERDA